MESDGKSLEGETVNEEDPKQIDDRKEKEADGEDPPEKEVEKEVDEGEFIRVD